MTARRNDIIFFDGECTICNRFVGFCLKRDAKRRFHYAPIDGVTWNECFKNQDSPEKKTIHLLMENDRLTRSSAVIEIFREFGGGWRILAGILWLIPRPIRDVGYRLVAGSRKRISRHAGTCRIPESSESPCLLP